MGMLGDVITSFISKGVQMNNIARLQFKIYGWCFMWYTVEECIVTSVGCM